MPGRALPARVDLHLHSPVGGDYRGDPNTSADEIAARCLSVGLDLVVIADHMTVAAWPAFQKASQLRPSPHFLPGAEVKVRHDDEQIHLVAIFNPGHAAEDFDMVVNALAPFTEKNGSLSTIEIASDPAFVAGVIKAAGALCMAAHIDRPFVDGEPEPSLRLAWELAAAGVIDAVEFDDPVRATWLAARSDVPCLASSDAHALTEIGRRHTRLLLPELSFEGLRSALSAGQDSVLATRALALA